MLELVTSHETQFVPGLACLFSRTEVAPRHPGAKLLLQHWRACMAKNGGVVLGRDIPAPAISHLMQNVLIGEPLADDIRFLLAGAAVRTRQGCKTRVSFLSELFEPGQSDHFIQSALAAMRSGEHCTIVSGIGAGAGEEIYQEHVLLPVTPCNGGSGWLAVGAFAFA